MGDDDGGAAFPTQPFLAAGPPYQPAGPYSSVFIDMDETLRHPNLTNRSGVRWSDNQTRNGTSPMEEMDMPTELLAMLIVLYTLTTTLAVVGNAFVIIVFTVGAKRSRTDLRLFLINLACADLIMAIFCMPFTFTMTMLKNWIFSAPMCPIVLYMQLVSVTASVCTNMSIGIDRFWVVTFPLKSRITHSRSKVIIVVVVWIIALGFSSVQLFVGRSNEFVLGSGAVVRDCNENWPSPTWRRGYTFFLLGSTYLLPLFILSLTYGFVGCRLWQRITPGNADEARDQHQLKSKRKVIKMLVVVVVLFGICWLPLHVFFLVIDFNPELTNYKTLAQERFFNALYYTVHWLAMSNSFVNPIIYGFLNDSFRHDLKRLLRMWFPCCVTLPCLKTEVLSRDSTMRNYSRHDRRESSTGSFKQTDPNRKLLTVRVNGYGRCQSEVGVRDKLLRHSSTPRTTNITI